MLDKSKGSEVSIYHLPRNDSQLRTSGIQRNSPPQEWASKLVSHFQVVSPVSINIEAILNELYTWGVYGYDNIIYGYASVCKCVCECIYECVFHNNN